MTLSFSDLVVYVIYVILVTTSINFQSLKEQLEVVKAGFSVNT
jgi:hypothetical protein